MKTITLQLTGYRFSGEIYGRLWENSDGTYRVNGKRKTIEEIKNMNYESLKTGDFQYLLGAMLEIYEIYDDSYERWVETIILGEHAK
jgi:hypothetical protein